MAKTARFFATFSVIAGAGLVLVPLTTYAENDSLTDKLVLEIDEMCSMTSSNEDAVYQTEIPNGQDATVGSTTFSVVCNHAGGWVVTATGGENGTQMIDIENDQLTIDTAGVSGLSGAKSGWGFLVKNANNAQIASGYENYSAVPSTENASIVSGPTTASSSFETEYKIYISPKQAAGTYVGSVVYTLAEP